MDALPGIAPLSLVLYADADVMIGVDSFRVWPMGVEFSVVVVTSPMVAADAPHAWLQGGSGNFADHLAGAAFDGVEVGVRIGEEDPGWCAPNTGGTGTRAVGVEYTGGGGDEGWGRSGWWAHPLPTEGPLRLACRWTGRGITSGWVSVDPGTLVEAATRAVAAPWTGSGS